MKMHLVVLLSLVVSLVALQGCSGDGTWFPNRHRPPKTLNYWDWRAPEGREYVSLLLLDERQLIASVNGYTYCLDPLTGKQHWFNKLEGFGSGVTSIAALDKHNPRDPLVAAAAADAAAGVDATR